MCCMDQICKQFIVKECYVKILVIEQSCIISTKLAAGLSRPKTSYFSGVHLKTGGVQNSIQGKTESEITDSRVHVQAESKFVL